MTVLRTTSDLVTESLANLVGLSANLYLSHAR
jgi:hypothetical protein